MPEKQAKEKSRRSSPGTDRKTPPGSPPPGLERRVGDKAKLAQELGIGEITLTDILKELEKPARDPREDMPAPILRSDVLDMKDLKPGMILKGTVRGTSSISAPSWISACIRTAWSTFLRSQTVSSSIRWKRSAWETWLT